MEGASLCCGGGGGGGGGGGLMGASKFQCIGETHVQMKGYKLVQAKILRHMECEGDFVNFQVVGGSPPVPPPH